MNEKSIIYMLCTIGVMLMIFGFSAQPLSESYKTSDLIVKPLENQISAVMADAETETQTAHTQSPEIKAENAKKQTEKTKERLENLYSKLQAPVRKTAHAFIFATLALFTALFLSSLGLGDIKTGALTFVFCALYAASDELHQRFVASRNSSLRDVCIDLAGAAAMLVTIALVKAISDRISGKKRDY